MRNPFRKITRSKRNRRTLKLALTPLGIALVPMLLLAQKPDALAAAWHSSGNMLARSAAALASSFRDPADVLAERSPGSRDPNALYSIKPERIIPVTQLANVLPHERVLSVVRDRPGAGPVPFDLGDLPPALFSSEPLAFGAPELSSLPTSALSSGDGAPGSAGRPAESGSPGVFALVPPTEPVASPPAAIVEVPSPVPEPATWSMMLAGFGAIGFAMRRKQRQTLNLNFA